VPASPLYRLLYAHHKRSRSYGFFRQVHNQTKLQEGCRVNRCGSLYRLFQVRRRSSVRRRGVARSRPACVSVCKLAKIENLRFHDLHHTFGTRAADEGVPLTAIAKVMGHASTQTTERYAHATDEGARRVVEALQKKPPLVTNWSQRERKEGIA
jgi:integrase